MIAWVASNYLKYIVYTATTSILNEASDNRRKKALDAQKELVVVYHGNNYPGITISYKGNFIGGIEVRCPKRLLEDRQEEDGQIELILAYIKNS